MRDPLNNDSNVFPDPHDSVTDSNMNPEIVTNDPDVRQRVVSKKSKQIERALFCFSHVPKYQVNASRKDGVRLVSEWTP